MNSLKIKNFSLSATLESGQLFRCNYDSSNGFYYIVVGSAIIKARQRQAKLEYECSSKDFDIKRFFGINQSYTKIIKSINKDANIAAAIKAHYGLRILEQPLWECTASFIMSSFSNIPRIRQCVERVAAAFGEPMEFGGFKTFSFPQPQQVNDFSKLKKCGLGFRARYLFETAKMFSKNTGYSQQQLRRLSYAKAKEKLMELPGVGSKVADCILLFSCGFYEAFPVDVWVLRAMRELYGKQIMEAAKLVNEKTVAGFARSYFGRYAGYAQQFIYHNARTDRHPFILKS